MAYADFQLEAMKKQFGAKGSEQAAAGISNYDKYMQSQQQSSAPKPVQQSYAQQPQQSYSQPTQSQSYSQPSQSQSYSQPSQSQSYSQPSQQQTQQQFQMPDFAGLTQQTINEINKKASQGIALIKPDAQKQGIYDAYLRNNGGGNTASGQQLGEANNAFGSAGWTPPDLFAPGASAKQSATLNGKNMDAMSGVYLGDANTGQYNQVSHKDAIANNPLHPVNANRNNLIQQAMDSGKWQDYDNFSAGQAPAHYEKDASGNSVKNKEYYASMIETAIRGENVDKARVADLTKDLMNAPGMMPYIPKFNSSAAWASEYGVPEADSNWFNSQYNNPQVRQDGRFDQNAWYDNQMFRDDPNMLSDVLGISGQGGANDEENANRQNINAGGYDRLLNGYPEQQAMQQMAQQQQPDFASMMQQQQANFDAQMQEMLDKIEAAQKLADEKNAYKEGEATGANKNATGGGGGDGSHIFAPGTGDGSAGTPGYTQSQNSQSDTLYKYLNNMWQGGF